MASRIEPCDNAECAGFYVAQLRLSIQRNWHLVHVRRGALGLMASFAGEKLYRPLELFTFRERIVVE